MKNIREYIILIVVIVVLAVVFGLQQSAKKQNAFNLPQTPAFTAQDLTRLEITTPETELTLGRAENGRWVILPEGYPVDERLSSIIEEGLANFKLTALISQSAEDYARYELDNARKVALKAYTSEDKVLELDFGAAVAGNFRHNYVRLAGDPNVYHGRGNLRTFLDTNAFELREKQILSFDRNAVAQIIMNVNGVERSVNSQTVKDVDGNEITIWLGPDDVYIDSGLVDGFLGFVDSTNVYDFLPMEQTDLGATAYFMVINMQNGTDRHVLRVFEPDAATIAAAEEEYSVIYNAVSSDVLSPFQLSYAQQSDILKRFDNMLKVVEEDEASGLLRVENLPEE